MIPCRPSSASEVSTKLYTLGRKTMPTVAHQELCSRMMVPGSERLARIWEMLCDESDAKLLLAMPGTAQELAEKCSLPLDETARRLDELYFKGVAFESEKPQGTVFRAPRHLI